MIPQIHLFVDGSCGTGGDVGTWAALAATQTERKLLFGCAYPTTISRMELTPIIEGLVWIRKNWGKYTRSLSIRIYSDSEYTVKTLSGMYEPSKNMDLWTAVGAASDGFNIDFVWYERNKLAYMEACDGIVTAIRAVVIEMSNKLFNDYKKPEEALPYAPLP